MTVTPLTLAADDRDAIVALFTFGDDALAERVARVGALKAEHKASAATIHAALTEGYDVAPVGLSLPSVSNALAAWDIAADHLTPDARRDAYAAILTGIHAVRVKPLREAWAARIAATKAKTDAAKAALIPSAITAATSAREAEAAAKAKTKAETKAAAERDAAAAAMADAANAGAEPDAGILTGADDVADVAPTSADIAARIVAALTGAGDALAALTSADDAAHVAAAASALAALAADRAAALTPAAPVPAPRKRAAAKA